MTSLVVPRFEIPILDKNGRMSRDWYKFFAQIAKTLGPSLTTTDDLQTFQNVDSAALESMALSARADARSNQSMLFDHFDLPKPQDVALLAFWPGDMK